MNVGGVVIPLKDVQVARENGIKDKTLRQRISNGWSIERAISEPTKKINRRNKFPEELIEMAEQNGINRKVFVRRVYSGWSLEEAATIPYSKSRDDLTETEELIAMLGRMKYLNRTANEGYNPVPLMKKLKVTWDDIREVRC